MQEGQAGATVELQVTEQMLEAGVCALLNADGATLAYQAEAAFLAMLKAASMGGADVETL